MVHQSQCFGLYNMKRQEVFLLPLDGMLIHRWLPQPFLLGHPNSLPVLIYTPGWKEVLGELSVLSNIRTLSQLGPVMLYPESNILTIRPLCLLRVSPQELMNNHDNHPGADDTGLHRFTESGQIFQMTQNRGKYNFREWKSKNVCLRTSIDSALRL